jgi:aryl-alcohol dehydrogenase-like predicted oxidoreductase
MRAISPHPSLWHAVVAPALSPSASGDYRRTPVAVGCDPMWSRAIPAVGSGDVSVARALKRGLDATDVRRAVEHVIESGLDLIDVAAEEAAEHIVADAIRSLRVRDRIIAAYRVPAIAHRLGVPTRDTLPERLPPRYIVDRVESILRATRLDAIPLAQLGVRATWRSSSAWPEVVGTCMRLVREGKVLEWGAFVDEIEDDTPELLAERWLVAISIPYSLCERAGAAILDAATGVTQLPAAAAAPLPVAAGSLILSAFEIVPSEPAAVAGPAQAPRIKVLARRPLAGAALAGTIGPGAKLRIHDDRNTIDAPALERIAIAVAKLARFTKQTPPAAFAIDAARAQLERNTRPPELHVQTLAELALRYVVSRGAIALPRLHRQDHVADALIAAHSPPLPPALIEQLDQLDI